jgi:hypothetical protein
VILRLKSPNHSCRFLCPNQKPFTTFVLRLNQETVTTGFEAKLEKTVATGFEAKLEKTVRVILMPNH